MKSGLLSRCPQKLKVHLKTISALTDKLGLRAYLVGGIVRDLILRRSNSDWDIVVEGDALRLARELAAEWKGECRTHHAFRTATVVLPDGWTVDFATCRSETYSFPGALPSVKPGTLQEDLFRRDFTINTLAIALHKNEYGQIVDFFEGQADLRDGLIRVLHDQSFLDDPTRILRAVRFEQRFGFTIEAETFRQMKDVLAKAVLPSVHPSRHFRELKKILLEADPLPCLNRLKNIHALGLFGKDYVFDVPSLIRLEKQIKALSRHPAYVRFSGWWFVRLLVLTSGFPDDVVTKFSRDVHLTREEKQCIVQSRQVTETLDLLRREKKLSEIHRCLRSFFDEVVTYFRLQTEEKTTADRIDWFIKHQNDFTLSVTGDDIKRFGVKAGQQIGRIMADVLAAKIDGVVKTKSDELRLAQELSQKKG